MVYAVIEPSKDGYGLYFTTPSLDGITTFGITLDEVKENARDVLKELIEVYTENNEVIPVELTGVDINDLKITFKLL
jgi:predicted RNase H-like HicB family nuclease